jgi:hypothetical protein
MITIRKTGKTWSIFKDGKLVEGGFFSRAAAIAVAYQEYGYRGV